MYIYTYNIVPGANVTQSSSYVNANATSSSGKKCLEVFQAMFVH